MSENENMTITEFLEARIAEDEARASSGWARLGDSRWETSDYGQDFLTPSAVLAECAAKRALLDIDFQTSALFDNHRALAAIYKDHPDYRTEWA